ncbi:uncharacterized protein [Fopius arisanus]|uniref:Uncharacterized protein n=1 Tax=Fopius arisanus TaxID=64838 RepID=A0A9R1U8Y0_9HYME|nr:PREDICTED: uncharacterized protein LOC105271708 [Fopius arisanus]
MDCNAHFDSPDIQNNAIYQTLNRTGNGKAIIAYYKENLTLAKRIRCLLSREVITREKDRQLTAIFREPGVERVDQFKITKAQFESWATDIAIVFPGEYARLYYKPFTSQLVQVHQPNGRILSKRRKENPSGILYDHYVYLQGKLKNQHLVRRVDIPVAVDNVDPIEVEDEALDWLSVNLEPAAHVSNNWTASRRLRKARLREGISIHEYYELLPVLKTVLGSQLLSSDFDELYPGRDNIFQNRWDAARGVLIAALDKIASKLSPEDLRLYSLLPRSAEHVKDAILLHLLPYLITPPRQKLTRGQRAEKRTVIEKQEAFLIHAKTAADINTALENQRMICNAAGTTLQAIPVFVGDSIDRLDTFYVYMNNSIDDPTTYQVDTILKAIHLTFKIFFALSCAYPLFAHSIWLFIQKALYNIDLPDDRCNREVLQLIEQIKQPPNENRDPNPH